ncbi:hypothetical protein JYT83_01375 [bacterium AH-315-F18]|nr:hypothetical protein [bacterium AH-315-F18]
MDPHSTDPAGLEHQFAIVLFFLGLVPSIFLLSGCRQVVLYELAQPNVERFAGPAIAITSLLATIFCTLSSFAATWLFFRVQISLPGILENTFQFLTLFLFAAIQVFTVRLFATLASKNISILKIITTPCVFITTTALGLSLLLGTIKWGPYLLGLK